MLYLFLIILCFLHTQTMLFSNNKGKIQDLKNILQATKISAESYWKRIQSEPNKLIIVRVVSESCPNCSATDSLFKKLSDQYPNIIFIDINYDEFKPIIKEYRVRTLPTFLFFKSGDQVYRYNGKAKESDLVYGIDKHLIK